ncbi:MAG: LacI family transcriptional regulator [Burkholderiaceae bacterium]
MPKSTNRNPEFAAFTGGPQFLRATDGAVAVPFPIRIRRFSSRKQVALPPRIWTGLNVVAAPTALQAALARGYRWLRQIESGKVANVIAISKAENVDRSYDSRTINLTTLAPEIRAAILDETLPDTVSLFDLASDTPLSWEEQRGRVEREVHDGRLQFG